MTAVAEQGHLHDAIRIERLLDYAPVTVVRLDRDGRITYVNEAWRKFARENGATAEVVRGIGLDYVVAARGDQSEDGADVAAGLCELIAGGRESFSCEYSCHSPLQPRWFRLEAAPIPDDDGFVLIHTDVTEPHLAQARSRVQSLVARALSRRAPLVATCNQIMRATCEGLEWDFAALWLPQEGALRCVQTLTRPGCDVSAFARDTRATRLDKGQGLPGRVWARATPQWYELPAKGSESPRASAAEASGFRSGFAVPLGADGEVLAVLEFFSRVLREPDLSLLELLTTSGAQLGAQLLRQRAELRAAGAEAAQRSIRNTLDAIMECLPAIIIVVDARGRIQFINRVLSHHNRENVIGSDWLLYLPPSEADQHRARLQRVIDTGAYETYETTTPGPDGKAIWFSSHIGPLRQRDRVVGAVLVTQDVTELKRTQIEFAAAQRLVAVGTLASGIAHEINTPIQFVNDSVFFLRDAARDIFTLVDALQVVGRLAAAGGPADALQQALEDAANSAEEADLEYLRENVPKAFDRCSEGLARVTNIVRSMKEFAHPASSEMAPADLNHAIESTLAIARNEYKYVAEVVTELGEIPPVTCFVNDINQVVLNLLVNATHAIRDVVEGSEQKGTITVRTRTQGESVVISVADTGSGIPHEIAHRIFEPFFTTKDVGKGTGQGLALAWAVVTDKHGGELRFESELGRGTTFFVRLPVAGKAAARAHG